MTWVALLRGVNVGGRNLMKMPALKACLEDEGFDRVETFIQSGNIVFRTARTSVSRLTVQLENAIERTFGISSRVVVVSRDRLKTVIDEAPAAWRSRSDLRRNIAFLRPPVTAAAALREVDARPGVDTVDAGKGVLYMTTTLRDAAKSRLPKIVTKPVYREMTIRTCGTCQKILALMEKD
jgi:uncharacterized protein (DUF1697 family)